MELQKIYNTILKSKKKYFTDFKVLRDHYYKQGHEVWSSDRLPEYLIIKDDHVYLSSYNVHWRTYINKKNKQLAHKFYLKKGSNLLFYKDKVLVNGKRMNMQAMIRLMNSGIENNVKNIIKKIYNINPHLHITYEDHLVVTLKEIQNCTEREYIKQCGIPDSFYKNFFGKILIKLKKQVCIGIIVYLHIQRRRLEMEINLL